MCVLAFLKVYPTRLVAQLTGKQHSLIGKTILCLTAVMVIACQIITLQSKQQCDGELLNELQQASDRLQRVESSVAILERTVERLLNEKRRNKRMAESLFHVHGRTRRVRRRRAKRKLHHELRYLRRKMKLLEMSLQCSKSENGTDNKGRPCKKFSVGKTQRTGKGTIKPKTGKSSKKNPDPKDGDQNDGPRNRGKKKPSKRSAVFVRWGTPQCRTSNKSQTSLVYSGRVASPHYRNKGGGSNYLCMPNRAFYTNPKNISNTDRAYLYPVKYGRVKTIFTKFTPEILKLLSPEQQKLLNDPLDFKDVPCAVCRVEGATTALMIPAHNYCPPRWNRQYHGYLMSQKHDLEKSQFICVDVEAKGVPNTQNPNGDSFLHLTEYKCGSYPCGGYQRNKALTCAVCTT